MEGAEQRTVTVYTESNPNPSSLKFVVEFLLVPETVSVDYPDKASATNCPLALELFEKPYVERVFIASNFVTVTKNADSDWYELIPEVKKVIKDFLEAGKPLFHESPQPEAPAPAAPTDGQPGTAAADEPEIDQKIRGILNDYIRPAVEQDGGNISFHSYKDGVVKVLLQGACSGCPSSTLTLKAGIENLLKRMIPEVQEVVAEGV